nr:putative late blight resistance protein homolog R1B-8 [Ipomoea batatas]
MVFAIDSEIIDLTSDIETFNARLVDASKTPRAKELQVMKVIVKKFRAVVDEAKDAIDKYFAEKKSHEDRTFTKCFDKVPHLGKVNAFATEIQSIRTKVNAILQNHERDLLFVMQYPTRPVVEKEEVVGFDGDLKTIKGRITEASDKFIVIPIVGMAGTGKTTFAETIFYDPEIRNKFVLCIWVHVSQCFDRKQKLIDIIHQIKEGTDDYSKTSGDRLRDEIKKLLNDQKYFVVLDDVWEREDWKSLNEAFPENSKGSRVVVTTRYKSVIDKWEPHTLTKLTAGHSWCLLEKRVFGKEGCDNKSFEEHGREIANKCNGLPLAITVIAGSLCNNRNIADWERIAKNPFLEINREGQSYHELVMLNYEHLSNEKLKNCFLYFASFPMGYAISVWKLIRLWIVEEFIPTIDEWGYPLDMEVEAHKYLNNLVDRNLVMVMKKRADGQIKTCRIHDSLHEFCKSEAAKKNLFRVMDEAQRLDANAVSSRRLCFYSPIVITNIFDAESSNDPSSSYLSCYNKKRGTCPSGLHTQARQDSYLLTAIPNTFPLLRVLDIESLKLKSVPDELYDLNLLRYLAITVDIDLLPKQFRRLRDLETLVFRTTKHTLRIDGGIWKMEKLRHVHTNTCTHLPPPPKNYSSEINTDSTDIQTLSFILPSSCTAEILGKTPNLQKLGIRGNIVEPMHMESNEGIPLFENLQMLSRLDNLKLLNNGGRPGELQSVPQHYMFPRSLRKLTLSNMWLEWKDMRILGALDKLEVLKLKEHSFMGRSWDNAYTVFKQLRFLMIGRTDLVEWKTSASCFPKLEKLVLKDCPHLSEIPPNFAELPYFKQMELYGTNEGAANSAKKIQEEQYEQGTELFKLLIDPPPN